MRSPFPPPHGVWSRPRFLFCLVFVSAPPIPLNQASVFLNFALWPLLCWTPYMCYDLVGVSGHQDTLNFGFSLSGARSLGRAVTAQHSPDFIIHMTVSIIRIIYEYSYTYIYIYIAYCTVLALVVVGSSCPRVMWIFIYIYIYAFVRVPVITPCIPVLLGVNDYIHIYVYLFLWACIEYVLLTSGGCLGLLHSCNDHYMNIFSTGRF